MIDPERAEEILLAQITNEEYLADAQEVEAIFEGIGSVPIRSSLGLPSGIKGMPMWVLVSARRRMKVVADSGVHPRITHEVLDDPFFIGETGAYALKQVLAQGQRAVGPCRRLLKANDIDASAIDDHTLILTMRFADMAWDPERGKPGAWGTAEYIDFLTAAEAIRESYLRLEAPDA